MGMFYPDSHPFSSSNQTLPTIIFFFGGGFRTGTPDQFYPYCEELKKVGMIAIAADYRIKGMGKNGGLVPLRPYQNIGWEEGPKGPTSGVLGGYGRKASAAALEANRDVEMKKVR